MAVLLDTNVVSELLRPSPDPAVERWVGKRPATDLYFSVGGEAELRYGVAILPTGRRRDTLAFAIEAILREDLDDGRILPFDRAAAREYADIAAARRSTGRPIAPTDCQIAAIARSRDMAVVTRNVQDFDDTGIEVADPWVAA
ncbi:MAG: type II toxin-antitoxin system VapC family toxin [Acidobacteriia bacterium]|nr:type II toxin-antitoxin system VapC family toxin [Terriglobia bacterium]MYG04033.1 type II toxin-antitoxin system VapC family toxin [Terriglobia bacterium]MYK11455.1 type II toxin-antitoxin system VapC family toxin [Terriglobia bacterium]